MFHDFREIILVKRLKKKKKKKKSLFAFQKSHRVLLLTKNLDIAMYKPVRISQKESNISKVSFGSSLISKRPKIEWNEIF